MKIFLKLFFIFSLLFNFIFGMDVAVEKERLDSVEKLFIRILDLIELSSIKQKGFWVIKPVVNLSEIILPDINELLDNGVFKKDFYLSAKKIHDAIITKNTKFLDDHFGFGFRKKILKPEVRFFYINDIKFDQIISSFSNYESEDENDRDDEIKDPDITNSNTPEAFSLCSLLDLGK